MRSLNTSNAMQYITQYMITWLSGLMNTLFKAYDIDIALYGMKMYNYIT